MGTISATERGTWPETTSAGVLDPGRRGIIQNRCWPRPSTQARCFPRPAP